MGLPPAPPKPPLPPSSPAGARAAALPCGFNLTTAEPLDPPDGRDLHAVGPATFISPWGMTRQRQFYHEGTYDVALQAAADEGGDGITFFRARASKGDGEPPPIAIIPVGHKLVLAHLPAAYARAIDAARQHGHRVFVKADGPLHVVGQSGGGTGRGGSNSAPSSPHPRTSVISTSPMRTFQAPGLLVDDLPPISAPFADLQDISPGGSTVASPRSPLSARVAASRAHLRAGGSQGATSNMGRSSLAEGGSRSLTQPLSPLSPSPLSPSVSVPVMRRSAGGSPRSSGGPSGLGAAVRRNSGTGLVGDDAEVTRKRQELYRLRTKGVLSIRLYAEDLPAADFLMTELAARGVQLGAAPVEEGEYLL